MESVVFGVRLKAALNVSVCKLLWGFVILALHSTNYGDIDIYMIQRIGRIYPCHAVDFQYGQAHNLNVLDLH